MSVYFTDILCTLYSRVGRFVSCLKFPQVQIHNFLKKCEMDPPYNVHLTQNSVQCKPNTKIVHHSANRGSGVVFLLASGFLQQKTDVVMTKEAAVNSFPINILCIQP